MSIANLNEEQYGQLFDVRRSIRYHDRRRSFYEICQKITNLMSILMAGSVLFDMAKPGENPWWLILLSGVAALLAALDMVIGYGKFSSVHTQLRSKFADLEIRLVTSAPSDKKLWQEFQRERLLIEKDEPPIYKVLDLLCRNELLEAEGFRRKTKPEHFFTPSCFQKITSQFIRWDNVQFKPN